MKRTILFFIFLFLYLQIFSYVSLYNENLSDFNIALTAKGAGLGDNDFFFNPLLNPTIDCKTENYFIALGFLGLSTRETRSKYVFDSYENSIAKKNIYDNSFLYGEPAYIIGYMPINRFGLYLGYENYINNDYTFRQIYRDDNYITLYDESWIKIGNVNSYFLSLNYRFFNFTLGTNFSILQGDGSDNYSILYVDPSLVDSLSTINENYSGIKGNLGISYDLKDFLSFTFVYDIQTYLTINRVEEISATDTIVNTKTVYYILPNIFSFGFRYRASGVAPADFYLTATYERWSELNGDFYDYNDLIKYNLGVSHTLNRNLSLLYGFMYKPYRKDNRIVDIGFTTGLIYRIEKTEFTVSTQYNNINYEKENVYYNERVLKMILDVSMKF